MDVDSIHSHVQQSNDTTVSDVCQDTTHECLDATGDVVDDLPLRVSSIIAMHCQCTIYFALLQKSSVSVNSAAERVRIALKEISTLTYNCPSADDLIQLDEHVTATKP